MILFVNKLSLSGSFSLSTEQVRHLKAKRIAHEKISITLTDGLFAAHAILSESHKREIIASYTESWELPPRKKLFTLCFGVIKPDRMSWLVEKSVELGVDRLVPLWTERAQRVHFTPSILEHLRKVVISACTQSLQLKLPQISTPISLIDALEENRKSHKFYGSLTEKSLNAMEHRCSDREDLSLWIGPEGGWSEDEERLLKQHATSIYYPGPILRTETACTIFTAILLS